MELQNRPYRQPSQNLNSFTPPLLDVNSHGGGAIAPVAAAFPLNSSMESCSTIIIDLESPILIFLFFHKAILLATVMRFSFVSNFVVFSPWNIAMEYSGGMEKNEDRIKHDHQAYNKRVVPNAILFILYKIQ